MGWCVGLIEVRGKAISVLSQMADGTRAQQGASLSLYLSVCLALSGYGSRRACYLSLFERLAVRRGLSIAHMQFEQRGEVGGEPFLTIPWT